ncbi:MAG TPA: hypothetical protein VL992_20140, partial [Tepidisphaeraceae bacterium]|nr:hypothetical protein [Tepidisphaeraceae bacterium]
MVIAHHAIFTTYGFWLPNDPRGSWSDFVRSWDLLAYGPATKTNVRHSVARTSHDRQRRLAARRALKYEPVLFTGIQARSVSIGFRQAIEESQYKIRACSILPAHVHMVIERHPTPAERMIGHLKARATQQLVADGLHPFAQYRAPDGRFPSVWTHRAWKVFLSTPQDVARAIRYVEDNPPKDGKSAQRWSFVT